MIQKLDKHVVLKTLDVVNNLGNQVTGASRDKLPAISISELTESNVTAVKFAASKSGTERIMDSGYPMCRGAAAMGSDYLTALFMGTADAEDMAYMGGESNPHMERMQTQAAMSKFTFEDVEYKLPAWRSALFGKVSAIGDLFSPVVHRTYLPIITSRLLRICSNDYTPSSAEYYIRMFCADMQDHINPNAIKRYWGAGPMSKNPSNMERAKTYWAYSRFKGIYYSVYRLYHNMISESGALLHMHNESPELFEKVLFDRCGLTSLKPLQDALEEFKSANPGYMPMCPSELRQWVHDEYNRNMVLGEILSENLVDKTLPANLIERLLAQMNALPLVQQYYNLGLWGTLRSIYAWPERFASDLNLTQAFDGYDWAAFEATAKEHGNTAFAFDWLVDFFNEHSTKHLGCRAMTLEERIKNRRERRWGPLGLPQTKIRPSKRPVSYSPKHRADIAHMPDGEYPAENYPELEPDDTEE